MIVKYDTTGIIGDRFGSTFPIFLAIGSYFKFCRPETVQNEVLRFFNRPNSVCSVPFSFSKTRVGITLCNTNTNINGFRPKVILDSTLIDAY